MALTLDELVKKYEADELITMAELEESGYSWSQVEDASQKTVAKGEKDHVVHEYEVMKDFEVSSAGLFDND